MPDVTVAVCSGEIPNGMEDLQALAILGAADSGLREPFEDIFGEGGHSLPPYLAFDRQGLQGTSRRLHNLLLQVAVVLAAITGKCTRC